MISLQNVGPRRSEIYFLHVLDKTNTCQAHENGSLELFTNICGSS